MPAGVQKNVRLSEQGAELLRALKYDLDASDGEVVAAALEQKALERLQYHAAILKRVRFGWISEGEAAPSAAAVPPLLAGLNWERPRFRIDGGAIQRQYSDGDWRPGAPFSAFGAAAQAVVDRTVQLVAELTLPAATAAVVLLACCESPEADRFMALGVPAGPLAARLRESLPRQAVAERPQVVPFTWAAKSVLVEGCIGMAVLDGIQRIDVEHILVAALQSDDADVLAAKAELEIDADKVRASLWS